jgi:hypothetical protein
MQTHGASQCMVVGMMTFRMIKLLLAIGFVAGAAYVVPVAAETLKKEPDEKQLSCGQKVLVENQTCSPGQVLEITGSCLNAIAAIGAVPRGLQYNCIKRK